MSIKNRITGFWFRPKYEKIQGRKVLKSLEIELLENGNVISTEYFNSIDNKQLERLQTGLLDTAIINLNVQDNLTEAKKISKRNKVLGVINMFKIDIVKKSENGLLDIKIIFIKSGYFFTEAHFEGVSKEKIEEIRYWIADNTAYNLICTNQCSAITALDLIFIIDQKLNGK